MGEAVPCTENFLGYSFIIKGKVRRWRRTLSFLSRHASIISSSSRSGRGVFLFLCGQARSQVIVFHVCREHIQGIINLLNSMAGCGSQATIVLLFRGMSHASVAWFCYQASLLGFVVKNTCFLE